MNDIPNSYVTADFARCRQDLGIKPNAGPFFGKEVDVNSAPFQELEAIIMRKVCLQPEFLERGKGAFLQ